MPSTLRFPTPRPSRFRLSRIARCSALCCALSLALSLPHSAFAAALGEARLRSALGQSLDVDIIIASLSASESDSLMVRLASPEAFTDASIEYTPMLRSLRLFVEKRADAHIVRITSDLPVNDPFVRLLVELSVNGSRMIREYTLLIDPPVLDASTGKLSMNESATDEAPLNVAPANDARAKADTSSSAGAVNVSRVPAGKALEEKSSATRVVRRGDTLRLIGAEIRPEGLQLEQVMVALQNANPEAFIDHNINRVRRGSVLRVPGSDAIRAIEPAQALRMLHAQTLDFLRYQQRIAQPAANLAPSASDSKSQTEGIRSSSGQVGIRGDEPQSVAVPKDKLTLSAPGGNDRADGKTTATDALDKIASDKAQADTSSRIAALEKNIGQLQQMLEIRNGELAAVQQRAAPTMKSGTPTVATEPQSAAEPTVAPTPAPNPTPEIAPRTEAPQAGPLSGKRPPRPMPAEPRNSTPAATSMLLQAIPEGPLTRAAAALFLLLPLIWAVLRWRRRSKPLEAQAVEPVVRATVIADAGGRHVDTRQSEFHSNFVPSVSQIDANEVDPVAEADVYIAYGRDEQAEEILLDALRAHPQRDGLRVKLLEIYAARKDRQKFGALATELRVLTHGAGGDWERAAQLGRQLDPGNRLFDVSTASHPADTPAASPQSSPVEDFGLRLEGLLDERGRDETASMPASVLPSPMREVPPSNTLDFSLAGIDAGTPSDAGSADEAALSTKLELALACQEIGDRDGARELLGEVAGSGHTELARRARSLLGQLA